MWTDLKLTLRYVKDKLLCVLWVHYKLYDFESFFSLLQGEFVEGGTETHFEIGSHICYIKAQSSGKRKKGLIHQLFVDNNEIPPTNIDV